MSASRPRRRIAGSIWLFAFVLGASAGGIAILGMQAARGSAFSAFSTYRAEPDGASACFDTLRALGFDCRRETTGLDLLEDDGSLVVLIEPFPTSIDPPSAGAPRSPFDDAGPMPPREVDALLAWVRKGGRLLVLDGHRNPIYDALGIAVSGNPNVQDLADARAAALSPVTAAAGKLAVASQAVLEAEGGEWVPLYVNDAGAPVVLAGHLEKGQVHVVVDPRLASNEGIGRASNLELLVAIAGESPSGSKVVRFDELRHGFAAERNVMGFARRHGLHLAVLQALLAFVMIAWAAARPRRRVRGGSLGKGIESREFITAMANIYARARFEQHAAQSYLRRLERSLAIAIGAPPANVPPQELGSRLRAIGIQNYRGWDSIVDEAAELGLALGDKRPQAGARRIGERRLVSFARLTTQLEREVRDAARITVDQVIA